MKLGKAIRAARTRADMSQAEVAAKLGVAVSTVCGWESNTHGIGMKNLANLAKVLDIKVVELFA